MNPIRVIVTGETEDLDSRFPSELGYHGRPIEWVPVPVLEFERVSVDGEKLRDILALPPDWILFTSQRTVQFFADLLVQEGLDFPLETQVGCIGERTAEVAQMDGFTPDFYPVEPGSEKFLEEFEDLLSNNSIKPHVFIPIAERGRTLIADRLRELGCEVTSLPIYRSSPRKDIKKNLSEEELQSASLIIFTSPSSAEAFLAEFKIPEYVRVATLGSFTAHFLKSKGVENYRVLPQGNFENVAEVLC